MKNVFISYASENQAFAAQLANSLSDRGIKSVLSGHDTREGRWLEKLRQKVETADGFILVMPAVTAKSSNNAFFEAGVARALGKSVVVVVPDIEEVDRSNIPVDLADAVIVDAAKKSLKSVADSVAIAVEN